MIVHGLEWRLEGTQYRYGDMYIKDLSTDESWYCAWYDRLTTAAGYGPSPDEAVARLLDSMKDLRSCLDYEITNLEGG